MLKDQTEEEQDSLTTPTYLFLDTVAKMLWIGCLLCCCFSVTGAPLSIDIDCHVLMYGLN